MSEIVFLTDVNALGFIRNAGPYRLVTELRENGYEVQVIDFVQTLPIDDVEKLFQKYLFLLKAEMCILLIFLYFLR